MFDFKMTNRTWTGLAILAILVVGLGVAISPSADFTLAQPTSTNSYIVQGRDVAAAESAVQSVGGLITDELRIIRAVGADLTDAQVEKLRDYGEGITIYENKRVKVSGLVPETNYPTYVGAEDLHMTGLDGQGVTVAVLDTGLWRTGGTEFAPDQSVRLLAQFDAIRDREDPTFYQSGGYDQDIDDPNGHGTHVASVILSSNQTSAGRFQGVAPGANIVAVRAFEADGSGQYLDVIKSLDWIVTNKDAYNIRVLNLSFSGDAVALYWEDPLNQAIMATWQAGIVVVAAAGNAGPAAMTIGVPGNVPYVITVGAMTDNYTPTDPSDDELASFSSAGPTYEGHQKPEIVAPGGHILGIMPPNSSIALQYPQYMHSDGDYFTMSGTSQAAAVVSGVVALMLQNDPGLSPDDIKCRLMETANSSTDVDGSPIYTVFQQGSGVVAAVDAVNDTTTGCANVEMDIALDLAGEEHYAGFAMRDKETGEFSLFDPNSSCIDGDQRDDYNHDGVENDDDCYYGKSTKKGHKWHGRGKGGKKGRWNKKKMWGNRAVFRRSVVWSSRSVFRRGFVPNEEILSEGSIWSTGLMEPVGITQWVEQE